MTGFRLYNYIESKFGFRDERNQLHNHLFDSFSDSAPSHTTLKECILSYTVYLSVYLYCILALYTCTAYCAQARKAEEKEILKEKERSSFLEHDYGVTSFHSEDGMEWNESSASKAAAAPVMSCYMCCFLVQ